MIDLLCCPVCKSKMNKRDLDQFVCSSSLCQSNFPIISNTPILINEKNSVFHIKDFVKSKKQSDPLKRDKSSFIIKFIKLLILKLFNYLPDTTKNVKAHINYPKFADLLVDQQSSPLVLVIGSGEIGNGLESIIDNKEITLVETDVQLGKRVHFVCDAHDLPFMDNAFDGVIIQAVLEHVCDPYRCVSEIHRVLKPNGLVYAETPFMQPGHKGRYDFTRFTHLGHRRLFRNFETIEDGPVCGPGMAVALTIRVFLWSFVKSKAMRMILNIFHRLTCFWLKYFDRILIEKKGTIDSASAFYLIGRKSNKILSDRELIKLYRGANE